MKTDVNSNLRELEIDDQNRNADSSINGMQRNGTAVKCIKIKMMGLFARFRRFI